MDDSTKNINEETAREETTCNPADHCGGDCSNPLKEDYCDSTLAMIKRCFLW